MLNLENITLPVDLNSIWLIRQMRQLNIPISANAVGWCYSDFCNAYAEYLPDFLSLLEKSTTGNPGYILYNIWKIGKVDDEYFINFIMNDKVTNPNILDMIADNLLLIDPEKYAEVKKLTTENINQVRETIRLSNIRIPEL